MGQRDLSGAVAQVAQAVDKLRFVTRLNDCLRFPPLAASGLAGELPELCESYEIASEDCRCNSPAVVVLARRLAEFIDNGDDIEDAAYGQLARRLYGDRMPRPIGELADSAWQRQIRERALLYDFASFMNCGRSARSLLIAAREGDEGALLQLVKIDKSILSAPWVGRRIRERQYAGDWEFFRRLAYWVRREPVDKGGGYALPVLVVALLWDELFRHCTLAETVDLVKVHCPELEGAADYEAFRRQLNRAGLVKRRYNRRIGH